RDLYGAKIEEVLVEGDEGYRIAKDFMRTLMPSHAKRVQPYRENLPLFTRYQIDSQLDTMHSTTVQLRSGGYIVIDATEALVAIDVNSGRATRERNIEETATVTNIEAAAEIARQLRLRDLAGLIVIDFIDMDENRNIRSVEKRLKGAVQSDRARIRMGRISSFGLLELSRQRLRPSLQEVSSTVCAHCGGSGHVRSVESAALHALRVIEEEGVRGRSDAISATMPSAVALYLVNNKRSTLAQIEERYGMTVTIETDDSPAPPDCVVQTLEAKAEAKPLVEPLPEAEEERPAEGSKRRRGRRLRRDEGDGEKAAASETKTEATEGTSESGGEEAEEGTRRRRRGRRGGRRRGGRGRNTEAAAAETTASEAVEAPAGKAADATEPVAETPSEPTADAEPAASPEAAADGGEAEIVRPKRRRRTRKKATETAAPVAEEKTETASTAEAAPEDTAEDAPKPKPRRRRRKAAKPAAESESAEPASSNGGESPAPSPAATNDEPAAAQPVSDTEPGEPRRGWWQRITGS
ncbi:MAG: ribonuclease E/G, partial [Alphaproteobacteria bacterium]|nr:ribonuclease E/G [Alphaproteobacteria bacterium]